MRHVLSAHCRQARQKQQDRAAEAALDLGWVMSLPEVQKTLEALHKAAVAVTKKDAVRQESKVSCFPTTANTQQERFYG